MATDTHGTHRTGATSGMDFREVQDRGDLARYLSQSLSSQYRIFTEEEVSQTSTYIKSYIVEADNGDSESFTDWSYAFPQVSTRQDRSLLLAIDTGGAPYFIDRRDSRFWLIHSIARTSETDEAIHRLVSSPHSGFDNAWMPTDFLLGTRRGGHLRGFKFSHQFVGEQPDPFFPIGTNDGDQLADDEEERAFPTQNLRGVKTRLTISDNHTALHDYQTIRSSNVFGGRQALDWIQFVSATSSDIAITNGVYTNGKVVGNGTSIELHLLTAERIRSAYAHMIRRIETDYAIGWAKAGQVYILRGEPLLFQFPSEITVGRLADFVQTIFRPTLPFRLFGIPHTETEDRIDVEAIDLHSGDPFSAEITRTWIRLYLPKGSCGNVVARLYANLQHAINSDVALVSGSGEVLFSEQDAG